MKSIKVFLFIIAILIANVVYAQSSSNIKFQNQKYDFGVFDKSKKTLLKHTFTFTNVGSKAICLKQVVPSYPQIKVSFPSNKIFPKQQGSIIVEIPTERLDGHFKKTITVRTDEEQTIRLFVEGASDEVYKFTYTNSSVPNCLMDEPKKESSIFDSTVSLMRLQLVKYKTNYNILFMVKDVEQEDFFSNAKSGKGSITFSNGETFEINVLIGNANSNYLFGEITSGLNTILIETKTLNDNILSLLTKYNIDSIQINNNTFNMSFHTALTLKAMYEVLKNK